MGDLGDRARAWLAEDPDPETRAEIASALASADGAALAAAFAAPLTFGTAGIRGQMGAGPARMNRLNVRRMAAGLAARLARDGPPGDRTVVVGRDARHRSVWFAGDSAAVLRAAGHPVVAFAEPVPTPLLAFAVRHLGAAAGVQVTASHNPPGDNGWKVYWADGAPVRPPVDAEIARAIAAAPMPVPLDERPVPAPGAEVREAYLRACAATVPTGGPRALRIVHTALHGVAGGLVLDLLARAGFTDVLPVPSQHEPDPDFPTVASPNPEEPGALDLALDLARESDADLVLANDPDGDRIAVAVPSAAAWHVLTGDELGCLLADDLLARGRGADRLVATTVVSSRLLGRIAAAHGARHIVTPTGFKWLAPAMAAARVRGLEPVLAYEQALGVMLGDAVRDKDGISAALAVADLVARLRAAGRTVQEALDDLARRHGLHLTAGRSLPVDGPEQAAALVGRALEDPPRDIAGIPVAAVADHRSGVRRGTDGTQERLATPPIDLLCLELVDGSRVQARPSGTEPIVKCYVEVVEPVGADGVDAARARALARRDTLADAIVALLRPA